MKETDALALQNVREIAQDDHSTVEQRARVLELDSHGASEPNDAEPGEPGAAADLVSRILAAHGC